jgi:hypothetical protein
MCEEILLEIMRIGLVSIRNLATLQRRNGDSEKKLKEWAELCHSLPPILVGKCNPSAIKYFIDGDAAFFLANYPSKADSDFAQVADLLLELNTDLSGQEGG